MYKYRLVIRIHPSGNVTYTPESSEVGGLPNWKALGCSYSTRKEALKEIAKDNEMYNYIESYEDVEV